MTPVIGICGGIGSGKSAVCAVFAERGGMLIDSDGLNHEVLRQPDVVDTLRGWWGEGVVAADGGADRRAIAQIVFADAEQKRRLESLVYPLIGFRREAMMEFGLKDLTVRAIILDSPLLFESNLDRLCDTVVFVETSESNRLQRLQRTRGWDVNEVRRREQWQLSQIQKRSRSAFTVSNDGSLAQLRESAAKVFEQIVSRFTPTR